MDLRATVRAAARSKGLAPDTHPPAEDLLDYHENRLRAEDRARLVWHLAACSECTQTVLDMAQFPDVEPLEEEHHLSEQDLEERWGRLLPRLKASEPPHRPAQLTPHKLRGPSLFSSPWFARAAAVVFLVISASLILNVRSLRRSALEPRLNVPIVELAAGDAAVERAEREEQLVRIPATADGALLVLTLVDPTPREGYEIEIRDAPSPEGGVLWTSTELERAPEGIFTLEIRRDFLPPGRYWIEITATEEGRRELLATYALRIEIE